MVEWDAAITIGCEVRIRRVGASGLRLLPAGIEADDAERVVAIVAAGEGGLYKLTPRTALAGALLGHRVGDVVRVSTSAGTVEFEVMAVVPQKPAARTCLDLGTMGAAAGGESGANGGPVVHVGDVVDVKDGQLEEWWRIVPHGEADALRRLISEDSPLGRALLGHKAGDVVCVRAPETPRTGRLVTVMAVKPAGPWE